ncbi:MAG: hypothetical protein ABIS50_10485 [Luteolibacter sp.]|uniref:hypothetical protein n=1 Tax=Luteolibacter sp. TaxID=1962973 RepID=UPI003263720E
MNESPQPAPTPPKSGNSCLLKVLIGLVILLLVLGGLWWWSNRPISPVVLTAPEKAAVEAKVEAMQKPAEPKYEKGSKEIILTERELNGLLNERTTFGKSVSFQLATDAILARIETDLPPDLPVVGGKRLKARARFLVGGAPGHPSFVIDDLTVWGISLPNDWLAGLKGRDLLADILGGKDGKITGVEEFKVEPERLIIRLKD